MSPTPKKKIKSSTNSQLSIKREPELLVVPQAYDIQINTSDLKEYFRNFKDAVLSKMSIEILLSILALWSPIITSDFKPMFGETSDSIRFGYIIFSIMLSSYIVFSRISVSLIELAMRLPLINKFLTLEMKTKYESDPQKVVQNILDGCKSKSSNV